MSNFEKRTKRASEELAHDAENIPRRIRLDKNMPAELAIWEAMQAVEKLEPNVHLTEAVNLLSKAKDKVADYFDAYLQLNKEPAKTSIPFDNRIDAGGPPEDF